MRPQIKGRFHPLKDLELERYLCGELQGEERDRLEQLIASRQDVQEYLADRRADRAAFRVRQPALALPERRRAGPPWAWGLGLAAAAVAFSLALLLPTTAHPPPGEALRIAARGRPKVTAAVLRDGRVFEYAEGVLVAPGDRVRLTVETSAPGFLTVIGRDGSGGAAVYHDNLRVLPGAFTLPGSLELDDSAGPEELFVFLSQEPGASALRMERILADRPLGPDVALLRLEKEPGG